MQPNSMTNLTRILQNASLGSPEDVKEAPAVYGGDIAGQAGALLGEPSPGQVQPARLHLMSETLASPRGLMEVSAGEVVTGEAVHAKAGQPPSMHTPSQTRVMMWPPKSAA